MDQETPASATTFAREAPADTTSWIIWTENPAPGGTESPWQLNENPVLAASLDQAVRQYAMTSEGRHLFRRGSDGTWTYWGCRLYGNEADARHGTEMNRHDTAKPLIVRPD